MARPPRRLLMATLAVLALVLPACDGGGASVEGAVTCPDGDTVAPPTGEQALPTRTLSVLGEDTTISTACWLGQPVVINFWAEWCEPCKAEMPDLEAVHQAVGEQVLFVGIDYEDRARAAIEFAEQVGVTYPLVEDPDGSYFDAVQGRGTPFTVLVDADGTIVRRHVGPLTQQALEELLAEEFDVEA